ncbi:MULTISPECIES: GspH/FimT family pseudopilin [unclassified Pseudoalteromonas]|jgi:type IV fimbrial biogenesis protein FimT|uniref:GspH/FimT family pseudopilin n=1 Tax=unclassified Pseudoalteromonas TaxID=194690 RepID=UPI0006D6381B|nr:MULTISPECIES: GspH/FimT family pseudopilin [unclassified Pseudoalteromonas]KPV91449.1 Type II transport protein GspH [Pseudoalteromonas sp. P1-30]KPW04420.1 Type II transport protein GspH [Pseudoalteromonas sp. P1-11]
MRLSTQTQAGYTLLELMASIAIVSIVSQISLSVFPDFLAKTRADNHVSLLHRNINYGRLYAIENGTYVTLCALKDNQCTKDEWDGKMSLFIDNDKSTSLDTDDLLISTFEKIHDADSIQYPRSAITFRPDGSLNGFQNGTFIYCPNKDKANLEGLALSVSQTGRIRIKSTDKCQKK